MSDIKNSLTELIGKTPLLRLGRVAEKYNLKAELIAKLENMNPGGSAKDRAALSMITNAEECGKLKKGSVIIEPTSGNTGIGIASIAAIKGYRAILTMPETMSLERRRLLSAYGAEIVLTKAEDGMDGAIKKAQKLASEIPDSFIPSQFTNPENPRAHELTTGPEIWSDTDGNIDIFVSAVGTGGMITGVGEYLKRKNRNIQIVAVEPKSSNVLSGGKAAPHKIQGIGAGFVPEILNRDIIDNVISVSDDDAYNAARMIAKTEGILVGISSGAALYAAIQLAGSAENQNKRIVVVLTDTGERYLSTGVFD